MGSRKKDALTLLLIIIIVIIIGIIGYLGFEVISDKVKETQAEEITDEFDKQIPTLTEAEIQEIKAREAETNHEQTNSTSIPEDNQNENGENQQGQNQSTGTSSGNSGTSYRPNGGNSSTGVSINNMWVVGKIVIPATGVRCSIFPDPGAKSLERGVGVMYSANGLNRAGNTVIAGHNYKNRLFFSRNKNLVIGNVVKITDTSGLEITYEIYNKFITNQDDASFFQRDTGGKREITLSTCTDDGLKTGQRIIIFAREI